MKYLKRLFGGSSEVRIIKKPHPEDIPFKIIPSDNDKYFKQFEVDINFFSHYNIDELMYFFISFQDYQYDTEITSCYKEYTKKNQINTDGMHNDLEIMSEGFFIKFLDNKIIKNVLINQDFAYSKGQDFIFKAYYSHFFKFLNKTYKNFHKQIFGNKFKSDLIVPKLCLYPIAFYFSQSQMKIKMEIFYSLVSNYHGKINILDFKLRLLLFSLIACGSGIFLLALNEIAKENEDVRATFQEDEFIRIYDMYQIKDYLRILDDVLAQIFDVTDVNLFVEIDYEVFSWRIAEKNLFWLFNPSGVRNYLEVHGE